MAFDRSPTESLELWGLIILFILDNGLGRSVGRILGGMGDPFLLQHAKQSKVKRPATGKPNKMMK